MLGPDLGSLVRELHASIDPIEVLAATEAALTSHLSRIVAFAGPSGGHVETLDRLDNGVVTALHLERDIDERLPVRRSSALAASLVGLVEGRVDSLLITFGSIAIWTSGGWVFIVEDFEVELGVRLAGEQAKSAPPLRDTPDEKSDDSDGLQKDLSGRARPKSYRIRSIPPSNDVRASTGPRLDQVEVGSKDRLGFVNDDEFMAEYRSMTRPDFVERGLD
ncbi:MAG: hypothetical protein AAGA65_26245 [Actinomycetota bacterium]